MTPFLPESTDRLTWACHGAGAGATVVLALLGWYGFQQWEAPAWAQLEERKVAVQALEEAKASIRDTFQAVQRKRASAEENFQQLKSRIPATLDSSKALMILSDTAAEHGVELADVRPQDHRTVQTFVRHKWRMTARGDFLQICRFIHAVEQLPVKFMVDELSFSADSGGKSMMAADVGIIAHARPAAPANPSQLSNK